MLCFINNCLNYSDNLVEIERKSCNETIGFQDFVKVLSYSFRRDLFCLTVFSHSGRTKSLLLLPLTL